MSVTIAYLSRAAAHKQVKLWNAKLSWITPHYAVKCNDMLPLLQWLYEKDVRFDCASPAEIRSVLEVGGKATDILYANPCKSADAIQNAMKVGVNRTVVDSVEEVEKLRDCNWKGEVLIRLAVPDKGSRQPFSSKFGATLPECPAILRAICENNIKFVGFSFHVGSECLNPQQYYTAIQICAEVCELAKQFYALKARVIDVGGGFCWETNAFHSAAEEIQRARKHFFAYSVIEWIAEPGRFFAQPTMYLEIPIIAVRRSERRCSYTLNESIYGMLSCIPFDGQKLQFLTDRKGPKEQVILFGNTCDSADSFGQAILPTLQCGDMLRIENIGAYSYVSRSNFNGFQKPSIKILE
jgi:ornithine decarboxylase